MAGDTTRKLTTRDIRLMAGRGERIVAITAYDAVFASLVDEVGVHFVLVGDSLGMNVLGYDTTIPVTIEESLHHCTAVVRGVKRALVVGDMPFLTYQVSPEQAMRNAGRYLQQARVDAVKLEGGQHMAPTVERLTRVGIPVVGHIGIMPQSVLADGGYRARGRTPEEAEELLADARALEQAGAFALVLEGISASLSATITAELDIPTIGIGAGPECSGQIQVINDVLGLFEAFVPRHTKRYAELADTIRSALRAYRQDVEDGRFPTDEHSFR